MFVRRKPYVGVAAVRYSEDIGEIAKCRIYLDSSQVLALGYQVSSKTLRGETNKHPNVFPPILELEGMLDEFLYLQEVEHHAHFFSDNPESDLGEELGVLAERIGGYLGGLQLNVAWPDPTLLFDWSEQFPDCRIILSLNRQALRRGSSWLTPGEVAEIIGQHYSKLATDVLFDLSGGLGITLPSEEALRYLSAIRSIDSEIRLGVAGGLGPRLLQPVAESVPEMWPLNIDAQSKLYGRSGRLHIRKVRMYLQEAGYLPFEAGTT